MWLLWNPFPLLLTSGRILLLVYYPLGLCLHFLRHDDGFTVIYSQVLVRSSRSGVKAKWTVHTKMELMTLTSLTKCTSQQSWCLCPRWLKWGERKTWERRTYLVLSVLLQERILTEKKSGSCEYLLGSIKSRPSKEKKAASNKGAEGCPGSEGMLWSKFMFQLDEKKCFSLFQSSYSTTCPLRTPIIFP